MFGKTEYVVVGLGLLSILATLLFYMFFITPRQAQLNSRKADRDALEKELASTSDKFKNFTTTEEHVATLVRSVDDFESRFLPVSGNGRTALYQRLNTLIAGYGLVNTSGPDYAPLEINQRQGQTENERGRAKYQSLFPGVYVTMTVDGSYQNLRRFLRDIETSQQFIIVSAVELEPTENQERQSETVNASQPTVSNPGQRFERPNSDPTGAANPMTRNQPPPTTMSTPTRVAAPRGRTIGETVSLHIELAAYFKRNSADFFSPQPQQQQ
jgi:Tfp pilus assembly protein PilO